jgi:hypothetical protein
MQAGSLHHTQDAADDFAARGGVVGGDLGIRGRAAELPGDFGPRCLAEGGAIIATAAPDGIKLGADQDGNCCPGNLRDACRREELLDAGTAPTAGAVLGA